jgi:acylphosphatase
MKEIQCKITGRVQMVMFRDFVCRKARGLDLVGRVQNLDDGSVRVVAQGNEETLKEFINKIHKGPVLAHVEDVSVEWKDPTETFPNFQILY